MTTNKKILIIEDDTTLATLIADQLQGEGFAAEIAHDGQEGLRKIEVIKPDAIILDIVMPKKDGIRMLEELHEKDPNSATPIIVLSNLGDMEHISKAMSNKAVAYLVKSDQSLDNIVDTVKAKLAN